MGNKYIGVIEKDEKVFCQKCGADLTVDGSVTFAGHWDGTKQYGFDYRCNSCGNALSLVFDRDEEDAALWGDET